MRIVGGALGGRPLVAPKGRETRPTTDRTRERLFNILTHRADLSLEGARILDLFAGSGALGFEAISRGGAFCLFVDIAAGARGAIRENQMALGLAGRTRLHRRSATALSLLLYTPRPSQVQPEAGQIPTSHLNSDFSDNQNLKQNKFNFEIQPVRRESIC